MQKDCGCYQDKGGPLSLCKGVPVSLTKFFRFRAKILHKLFRFCSLPIFFFSLYFAFVFFYSLYFASVFFFSLRYFSFRFISLVLFSLRFCIFFMLSFVSIFFFSLCFASVFFFSLCFASVFWFHFKAKKKKEDVFPSFCIKIFCLLIFALFLLLCFFRLISLFSLRFAPFPFCFACKIYCFTLKKNKRKKPSVSLWSEKNFSSISLSFASIWKQTAHTLLVFRDLLWRQKLRVESLYLAFHPVSSPYPVLSAFINIWPCIYKYRTLYFYYKMSQPCIYSTFHHHTSVLDQLWINTPTPPKHSYVLKNLICVVNMEIMY